MRTRSRRGLALAVAALAMFLGVVAQAQGKAQTYTPGQLIKAECLDNPAYYNISACAEIRYYGHDAGGNLYYGYAWGHSNNGFAYGWTSGRASEKMGGFWYDEGACTSGGAIACSTPPHHCSQGFTFKVTTQAYLASGSSLIVSAEWLCS